MLSQPAFKTKAKLALSGRPLVSAGCTRCCGAYPGMKWLWFKPQFSTTYLPPKARDIFSLSLPFLICKGRIDSINCIRSHEARGSASLLSSPERGQGPQDTLKKDYRGLSRVAAALNHPMDYSPSGSMVHGILQTRILELGCHSVLQGIFLTQGSNWSLQHCRQILYRHLAKYRLLKNGPSIFSDFDSPSSKCLEALVPSLD